MEAVLIVVTSHLDASVLQTPAVHQSVVPENVKLTRHHVRFGGFTQNPLLCQQWRRPHVRQRWHLAHHAGGSLFFNNRLEVLLALGRQQSAPVELGAGRGADGRLVQRAVIVSQQDGLEGGVGAQVLEPETSHIWPVEDRHSLVLLVRRGVEVQSLQHWVDQRLGFELHFQRDV